MPASDDHENEEVVFAALLQVLDKVERWQSAGGVVPEVQPASRTSLDDARSAPYQLSHMVEMALSHSLDHMHALRTLVVDAQTIHLAAPFTLMRAAIENAAQAAWLLMPDDADERVKRRLMLAIADARDAHEANSEGPSDDTFQRRRDRIVQVGVNAGLEAQSLMGGMSKWLTIVREAGSLTRQGDESVVSMWRLCSGYTHGRSWSILALADRDTAAGDEDVLELNLTAPTRGFAVVASTAAAMYASAKSMHDQHRLAFKTHHRR